MTIKEFLKPTKGNLILTILITLLWFYFWLGGEFIIECAEGFDCSSDLAQIEFQRQIAKVIGFPYYFISVYMVDQKSFINPYGFILNLIVWYIFSCLIFWIFHRRHI